MNQSASVRTVLVHLLDHHSFFVHLLEGDFYYYCRQHHHPQKRRRKDPVDYQEEASIRFCSHLMLASIRVKSFFIVNIFCRNSLAFTNAFITPCVVAPRSRVATMVSTRSAGKRLANSIDDDHAKPDNSQRKGVGSRKAKKSKPAKKAAVGNIVATVHTQAKTNTKPNQTQKPKPIRGANPKDSNALISLTENDDLISVTMVKRPSKRNRSPYVADVLISPENGTGSSPQQEEREAICHVPNLDMGGKCIAGATMLVKPARDRKGNLVGPDAVNPKYGTPKCEYIAQLLRVDETSIGYTPPIWVGAHPSLGEKIAEQLLARNCLHPHLPKIQSLQREVRNIGGSDMRADFLLQFEDDTKHKPCVLEVKTVVDTDFAPDRVPTDRTKCVFVSEQTPYRRAGIFPWGQSNQKGPDGEKVVSARAIKHVRELTRLTKGELRGPNGETYQTAVLFVVIRKDAEYFRPNHEACPSFCKYLKEAKDAGVQVFAKRVEWGDTEDSLGQCLEGPLLNITWPELDEE